MTGLDVNPDRWHPSHEASTQTAPRRGLRVAWRYSVWRIVDIHDRPEADWTDSDREWLARQPEHLRGLPQVIVLRHENGPTLDPQPGDDGTVHIAVPAGGRRAWWGVAARYPVCSCHGHPYPCLDVDRDRLVAATRARTERLLAGAQAGVCQSCRQPITARQKTVVFPEPSLLVPGAPGPVFHAGRTDCWWAAHAYETKHRLPAFPEVTRITSCPGDAFVHKIGMWVECTAGPACTGLHGAVGARKPTAANCATRVYRAENLADGYRRPLTDCGYRGNAVACLGSESGPCRPVNQGIADLLGGQP